jgi:Ni/Co efflux regulator RcnB
MRKVVMALAWGAVLAAAVTGTGCVRHWDDDHDGRHERYEDRDDDRHDGHERREHRS